MSKMMDVYLTVFTVFGMVLAAFALPVLAALL